MTWTTSWATRWAGSLKALTRASPLPTVEVSSERAGVRRGGPVPWSADRVRVEVAVGLPGSARVRTAFALRFPGREPLHPESLQVGAQTGLVLLGFALPVPRAGLSGELVWNGRVLAPVAVPLLTRAEFLASLRVRLSTLTVTLAGRAVPANAFVGGQCRGLTAAIVLESPAGLAPLADVGLAAEFRGPGGRADCVPVTPGPSPLAGPECLLSATMPRPPRRRGDYAVRWLAGDSLVHAQPFTALTLADFARRLAVTDAALSPGDGSTAGPRFTLAAREPLCAGSVPLHVAPLTRPEAAGVAPRLWPTTLFVADAPTPFAPGSVALADFPDLAGFELRCRGHALGGVALRPAPSAQLTAEGGFTPPPEFAWTAAAEDELGERLGKLGAEG